MRLASRALLALACALAAGACTTVDTHEKVAGWPELRVVEHHVSEVTMLRRCAKYVAVGMLPLACAEFDFRGAVCHVWYSADFPPSPTVMAHERLHCQGYDHPGARTLRDVLERYKLNSVLSTK